MNAPTTLSTANAVETVATPMVALAGNPNSGKSSLFNALTGSRQKTGNYPGVTVERRTGRATLAGGQMIDLLDLPGSYSLTPASLDEQVTSDVITGRHAVEARPDALIIVVDAANLENNLCFAQQLIAQGLQCVVALNMIDMATRDGLTIDADRLSELLGVAVIPTVAVRRRGLEPLLAAVAAAIAAPIQTEASPAVDVAAVRRRAQAIADEVTVSEAPARQAAGALDRVVMHPVGGLIILLALLFVMFQAVYAWSAAPMGWIEEGVAALQSVASAGLPAGFLRGLIVEGILGGVGAVIVFLPQILILFLFILVLEATGYMARAAFLMDGLMAKVGLNGRGFIPLLSSFACAIPGIMATRSLPDGKDRLTTILIAPLMTCSARLPVYTMIIAAFIPAHNIAGSPVGLQGLVLFCLYLAGIVGAMLVALVLRRTIAKGASIGIMMELPRWQMPRPGDIALGLWQRASAFIRRAGTIIMASTIVLWLLLTYPKVPQGSSQTQVEYSIAGHIADGLEVIVRPIGFNHEIALALIPAMAAREIAVSALATVNAVDAGDNDDATARTLGQTLVGKWSLATALAFLAWFVFAPQCISTIAVTRRETNSWRWPAFMVGYLFFLAYVAAGATYWIAVAFGLG